MILGKEDGVTYHVESPTAVKILQVAKSQQEASGPPRLGSLFWSLHPGPFSRDRGPRHIFLSTLLPLSWPGRSAGYKGGSRPFSRYPGQRRRTGEENQQRGGRGPRKRQQSTKKNVCGSGERPGWRLQRPKTRQIGPKSALNHGTWLVQAVGAKRGQTGHPEKFKIQKKQKSNVRKIQIPLFKAGRRNQWKNKTPRRHRWTERAPKKRWRPWSLLGRHEPEQRPERATRANRTALPRSHGNDEVFEGELFGRVAF